MKLGCDYHDDDDDDGLIDLSLDGLTFILKNVTVQNSLNYGCIFCDTKVILRDLFVYEGNNRDIVIYHALLTIDEGSHITFLHNIVDSTTSLYAEKSEIYIKRDSITTFNTTQENIVVQYF